MTPIDFESRHLKFQPRIIHFPLVANGNSGKHGTLIARFSYQQLNMGRLEKPRYLCNHSPSPACLFKRGKNNVILCTARVDRSPTPHRLTATPGFGQPETTVGLRCGWSGFHESWPLGYPYRPPPAVLINIKYLQ